MLLDTMIAHCEHLLARRIPGIDFFQSEFGTPAL
jgi:hypothetical protein